MKSCLAAFLLVLAAVPGLSAELGQGLVVEELRRGSTADKAGVRPGDVLLSWRRNGPAGRGAAGELRTPFDLADVFIEQLPRRGGITLYGLHGGAEASWFLPGGSPSAFEELKTSPAFTGETRERYRQALDLEPGARAVVLRSLAETIAEPRLAAWLRVAGARALAQAKAWEEADRLYGESVAPFEKRRGEERAAAQILREWGEFLRRRRYFDRAEICYRRALALDRRQASESLAVAWTWTGLGYMASFAGGSHEAQPYFERALRLRERLAAGSSDVAESWEDLGFDANVRGDRVAMAVRYRRAVEIQRAITPSGLYLAQRIGGLASAHYFLRQLPAAERLWLQALAMAEREAPEDRQVAAFLQGLGNIAMEKESWVDADGYLRRSLVVSQRFNSDSIRESDLLRDLGHVDRRLGKTEDSLRHLCDALGAIEQNWEELEGHADWRERWGFYFSDFYRDCGAAQVTAGHPEQGLKTLESGRARAFRNLLSERNLRSLGLPARPAGEWHALNAEYDRAQGRLAQLTRAGAGPEIRRLEGQLQEIRRRRQKILTENLPFAALRYPKALDLAEIRRTLEPGTALLFYSVGEEQTLLFAVLPEGEGNPGWSVFPLKIGIAELAKQVKGYVRRLTGRPSAPSGWMGHGQALYDLLVRPAEAVISPSRRVLIMADGPLHLLPFAALYRGTHPLIEWKPLHFNLSATAYAEILKARRPLVDPALWKVVAVGDPIYPPTSRFTRLPASRREIEEIASLFPRSHVLLAEAATETQVRLWARDARILHIAGHGLLDHRLPQNSALVLSFPRQLVPGEDNGFLQAWEVMEQMSLEADLVTLSACDTALGPEIGGEGLIGLTRAFQVAGASSVVATLWGVTDPATADLMMEFYRQLRAGKSKDEALQAAQVRQIRSAKAFRPFHWASFELYGDWR